jgi:phosphate-selective porin
MRIILAAAVLMLAGGIVSAAELKDQKAINDVHLKLQQADQEMKWALEANHDLGPHGVRAEELIRQAEAELQLAIEAAKKH